ncbi:hypothetical protein QFC21_005610 [Naganishia friedmannii]|uniref:Uncharacterized protein n=1 Tax=Naganishia friedmannii TaxID=89922 RepID=A0ACC2V7A7_9TREE|nr:hypothetical protein QFC21_005610 [Naganishia friedmannii]
MIRLRQVSVSFPPPSPSSYPTPPPAHASSTTKHGQLPATRKTYLVPSGLVTYPPTSTATEDEVLDVGVTKNMREAVGRSVGKSKYVLCRADTFSAPLGRKKDRKSLGQESEISPLIVEQITEQLQQRVLVELQNQRKRRGEVYDCVGEAGEFEALTSQEQVDVLERSRIPPRLAERGIYAFLDLRDAAAAAAPTATPPRNKAEELRYSDVPILYLQQQTDVATNPGQGNNSSLMTKSTADSRSRSKSIVETMEGELTAVPLFKIGSTLLGDSLHQSRKLLHGAIQPSHNLQEEQQQSTTAMIALCSPLNHNHSQVEISEALESNSFERGTTEGTAGVKLSKEGSTDGIPLFIALWRLRLWSGMGWTVSDTIPTPTTTSARDKKMKKDNLDGQTRHIDVEAEREEGYKVREQTLGQVVQGFQVVQGVMHGKWM